MLCVYCGMRGLTILLYCRTVASSMMSPALLQIEKDLGNTSHILTILTLSIYVRPARPVRLLVVVVVVGGGLKF